MAFFLISLMNGIPVGTVSALGMLKGCRFLKKEQYLISRQEGIQKECMGAALGPQKDLATIEKAGFQYQQSR